MVNGDDIRRIVAHTQLQADELDVVILRTPTGDKRNALTEAHVLILEAIRKLLDFS